ncbi:hypothetical protein CTI12_AA224920 [Artemisia annua]|uniref:Uncharacterized protein n=1 Tax=Artemisia annua TaxID=35608 RepID=A0A2U1NVB1_ARTAN|nr:hypothetical protein CTI12_AA224920 [Artemisia annua]
MPQNRNMFMQDENPQFTELSIGDQLDDASIIDSIVNAPRPHPSTARIHTVPSLVKETEDYEKYFVPNQVSIGPKYFGHPKLKLVEKLKPSFTMKLLLDDKEVLERLFKKLGQAEMVKELRNFYEERLTDQFCDKEFTKMMVLDGCFILYYIQFIFGEKFEKCRGLNSYQIAFVHQDLFLLENQIPFKVLDEVMSLMNKTADWHKKIKLFIDENILVRRRPKTRCFCFGNDQSSREEKRDNGNIYPDHLLHLLHQSLTKKPNVPKVNSNQTISNRYTFRNASELKDVGIIFKPSGMMTLAHIGFQCWWFFAATVKLPPITVDDSTKPLLLNLIAYEMCSPDAAHDSWVTSYICLLDSLIDHPDDVKALRTAGVLENSLGSDQEVAELFNEIGTDLVPNYLAYLDAKNSIQEHYEDWRGTVISQLKHEYVKSPWAFFALLGAIMALFLSGVQVYYTVWGPKSQCDELCQLLKNNHHL